MHRQTMAGVNIRLNAGGVRERHWHEQAERVYKHGTARITVIDAQGHTPAIADPSLDDESPPPWNRVVLMRSTLC
jgi:oxalate decarboxylase/phosphoglucose isomerase-like protein (cupin superfamily)